jgi:hypothetical protein
MDRRGFSIGVVATTAALMVPSLFKRVSVEFDYIDGEWMYLVAGDYHTGQKDKNYGTYIRE